jgi:hypothetical protein
MDMIDREARNQAAETIRHYVCGTITNRDFEKRYPTSKTDPIICALDDSLWASHEDIFAHKLGGENAMRKDFKDRVPRWLVFLYSDREYQWPRIRDAAFRDLPADSWFGNMVRRLFGWEERSVAFMAHGDYDVWPFLRREEFQDALKKPALLKGNI